MKTKKSKAVHTVCPKTQILLNANASNTLRKAEQHHGRSLDPQHCDVIALILDDPHPDYYVK